jgi:hypothetical protein
MTVSRGSSLLFLSLFVVEDGRTRYVRIDRYASIPYICLCVHMYVSITWFNGKTKWKITHASPFFNFNFIGAKCQNYELRIEEKNNYHLRSRSQEEDETLGVTRGFKLQLVMSSNGKIRICSALYLGHKSIGRIFYSNSFDLSRSL